MHELSLCQDIVRAVERAARSQRFTRVLRVRLEIGVLAGVEIEALRFGFEVAARDSVAERAALVIEECAGSAWCEQCRRDVSIPDRLSPCPVCGGYGLRVTGGTEMKIKNLEVE